MNPLLRSAAPAVIALVLAGCANMQWSRSGADAAAASRDLDACRAQALGRSSPTVAAGGSPDAITEGRRPPVMAPSAGSNERFVEEHEAVSACMIRHGYALRRAG